MQTHDWMRSRQRDRNGNRGKDCFRSRYYYLWLRFKNSTLYIHRDCVYKHNTAGAKWQHYWGDSSGTHKVQTHHTSSPALFTFPPTRHGSHRGKTDTIGIHSCETKKSVMRHSFCGATGTVVLGTFRGDAIAFGNKLPMNYALMRRGVSQCHNCFVKSLDEELEAAGVPVLTIYVKPRELNVQAWATSLWYCVLLHTLKNPFLPPLLLLVSSPPFWLTQI